MLIRTRKYKIALAFILGAIIPTILAVYLYMQYVYFEKESFNENTLIDDEKTDDQSVLEEPKKTVYALAVNKNSGEILQNNDIKEVDIAKKDLPADVVDSIEEIDGKQLKYSLTQNTVLSKGFISDNINITDDLREHEFKKIKLPERLNKND